MRIYECKSEIEMKRDTDLVRDLLMAIAEDPHCDGTRWFGIDSPDDLHITGHSLHEVLYHLTLLIEAGFIKGKIGIDALAINRLTWDGHEFLDNIRDAGIWGKTKERLKGLPSVAISVIGEIAKAEVKKHLGLP